MRRTCTFLIGCRGSGKTYFLLKEAEKTGAVIITSQKIQADLLKLRAAESGFSILDPVCWEDYQKLTFPETTRFLIDDLQELIFEIFKGKVDYAAVLDTLDAIHFNSI